MRKFYLVLFKNSLVNLSLRRVMILVLFLTEAFNYASFAQTSGFKQTQKNCNVLWYNEPANNWNEALPIGNGFMGAMIFGGVKEEHLQINENTLYSGEPSTVYKGVNIVPTFDKVVEMLRNNKNAEANEFVRKNWLGRLHQDYEPLGDLYITFANGGKISNYRRELDIANAVIKISYTQNGILFKREIFASNPNRAIVIRLSADKPGALNFNANLSSVHPTAKQNIVNNNTINLKGQAPGYVERRTLKEIEGWKDEYKHPEIYDSLGRKKIDKRVLYGDEIRNLGMLFESQLKAISKDGSITTGKDGLTIKGAQEVVLFLVASTSYNGFNKSPTKEGVDPAKKNDSILKTISKQSFAKIFSVHVNDYQHLFNRVTLDLDNFPEKSLLPTDQRIIQFKTKTDNGLAALLFQYGRYLMISSSRLGGQPANLQGMWNNEVIPPWNCGYTLNINAEMNYWPAEITNLSECVSPFFQMIKEISENGKETAKKMYGKDRGWVAHHNVSIWRETYPNDNNPGPAFWLMSGGWLSSHLWEHYLFTRDINFLRNEGYPIMKGAAEFYADWLIKNEKNQLITPVSTSPENSFHAPDKQISFVSMGSTMDMTIIREIFNRTIKASEILKTDEPLRMELQDKLSRILPFKIGSRGQLQEWQKDYEETQLQHRHISHLYGLYPGNQINIDSTPELFNAVRKSLELRGDKATGWSMAWKVNAWARLLDGNHAYKIIQNLFTPISFGGSKVKGDEEGGLFMNLLDACPPFQIDGNFGYTSGVAEMLLQSHAGMIQLLPALPSVWGKGKVTGLKTRGNFEVDIEWNHNRLVKGIIKSNAGGNCRIRTSVPFKVDGVVSKIAKGENPNPFFQFILPGKPEINPSAPTISYKKNKYYTIDFMTEKGKKYYISTE